MTGMNTWGTNPMDYAAMMGRWGADPGVAAPILDQALPVDAGMLQNLMPMNNMGAGAAGGPGFMQNMMGYRGADGTQFNGWGGMALGAASGLMSGFLGMKQLGLAKDQLAQGKKQFDINFGAQKKLTNSRLEDRQRARIASNPSAYQSVGDYMNKNGI